MRSLRHNLDTSRAILEWLQRRERRKRDILQCEIDTQMLQLRLRHEPPRLVRVPLACLRSLQDAQSQAAETTPLLSRAQAPQAPEPAAEADATRAKAHAGDLPPPPDPLAASTSGMLSARISGQQQALDAAQKRERKRRRDGRERRSTGGADNVFVPPPELPEPQMLFLEPQLAVRLRVACSTPRHALTTLRCCRCLGSTCPQQCAACAAARASAAADG